MSSLCTSALAYAARGWSILPVAGKKPKVPGWKRYQQEPAPSATIRRWFSDGKATGLAVVCGKVSGGLVCRDFDTADSYNLWSHDYPELAEVLPTVRTARGFHVYFTGDVTGIVNVESDGVHEGELQRKRLSGITVNEYVGTIKAFTRWCVSTGRLASDPLAALKKQNAARIDKTRPRRALTADEVGALLRAARIRPAIELRTIRHGPNVGKVAANVREKSLQRAERLGAERALAYLLALWTGLRRSELRALEWQDVRLDTIPAQLVLRAVTTKSKRADRIVLHPQVADLLRTHRP